MQDAPIHGPAMIAVPTGPILPMNELRQVNHAAPPLHCDHQPRNGFDMSAGVRMTLAGLDTLSGPSIPVHDAQVLTNGGQLAHILLNDQVYSLRITRAGKLILTK